jgi:DNA-binding NarL/FixJ family response regulator
MLQSGYPITVVLATDSYLFGEGLAAILASVADVKVVGRVNDFDELPAVIADLAPQAVVSNIRSLRVTTFETFVAMRRLKDMYPELGIVIVSDSANDTNLLELLHGGSSGIAFLLDDRLPDVSAILDALKELQMGNTVLDTRVADSLARQKDPSIFGCLTPRELEVLERVSLGLSNRGIAEILHLSLKSIEKSITSIFLKLGPFDGVAYERRVCVARMFLRTQLDPFGDQGSRSQTAGRFSAHGISAFR